MRRRQFGSIRKLPSGSYQVAYWLEGKRQIGPKTFSTKADASAYLATVEADVVRGAWINPELTETRFEVVANQWLRSNSSKRESSIARDVGILNNHVLPFLGHKAIGSIRPAVIQSLVDSWTSTYSANSVNRHYATVRSIFSYAEAAELIIRTPCRGIRLPRIRQVERPVLSSEELEALSEALGPINNLFMWCGALLGLRWSEIAGITRDRIDLDSETLSVDRQLRRDGTLGAPKSDAGTRILVCPKWMIEEFREVFDLLGKGDDELIFTTDLGTPLNYTNWRQRMWLPACEEAGLSGLRFHDLRAMAATALVASGTDVKTAQTRLGHSSSRMTLDIYARATQAADRKAAQDVSEFLRPGRS